MRIYAPPREFRLNREVEYGSPEQNETVQPIIDEVRQDGDAALRRYRAAVRRVRRSLSFASATRRFKRRTSRSTPRS